MPTATRFSLDPRVEQSLRAIRETLLQREQLLSDQQLDDAYDLFRSRFGPEQLGALEGEELLNTMHAHGSTNSLVYWLEFKNDEEFPGTQMGSIAGGSAHKFNLFKRKESGQWVTGSPQNERQITESEAIDIARRHRDQLIAGEDLLSKMSLRDLLNHDAGELEYLQLQQHLEEGVPDLYNRAWAHKYFSLLFPGRLDDYHSERWQRYTLLRSLLPTLEMKGLYVHAFLFVELAHHFDWPINHLTRVLNERNGAPIRYWRIGTSVGNHYIWPEDANGNFVAIGWEGIGDLSEHLGNANLREEIRRRMEASDPKQDPRVRSRKAGEVNNFFTNISKEDIVLAADGHTVLGVGRVTGPYQYILAPPEDAPNRRPVQWLSTEPFGLPDPSEGNRTTVYEITEAINILEIERRRLDGTILPLPPAPETAIAEATAEPPRPTLRLNGVAGRVQAILERKGQVILYGPPGTGKTYWANRCAHDLVALEAFGRVFNDLASNEQDEVRGTAAAPGLVRTCTFHPAYGYEDFLEGYRPRQGVSGQLVFELRDGIFRQLCREAADTPKRKFILLIDEINRGDIPRIFGELLTLLELDKRERFGSRLPLSGEWFTVPSNVWVIGTMNTADRSIALLDAALRRRFGFVELMPDPAVFGAALVADSLPLGPWLRALNHRVRRHVGRDARNLQIGHAYLLEGEVPITNLARFTQILADDILPLLEEYCYEDYTVLTHILGTGLVDEVGQRVRVELLEPGRGRDLLGALLAIEPEIATSTAAIPPAEPVPETPENIVGELDSESDERLTM